MGKLLARGWAEGPGFAIDERGVRWPRGAQGDSRSTAAAASEKKQKRNAPAVSPPTPPPLPPPFFPTHRFTPVHPAHTGQPFPSPWIRIQSLLPPAVCLSRASIRVCVCWPTSPLPALARLRNSLLPAQTKQGSTHRPPPTTHPIHPRKQKLVFFIRPIPRRTARRKPCTTALPFSSISLITPPASSSSSLRRLDPCPVSSRSR